MGARVRLPWILLLAVPLAVGGAARIDIGRFTAGDLSGWERKSFRGETEYGVREEGGVRALCARSRDAGSGLFRELEVDLGATPWIHWSWKVDAGLHAGDERTRAGDDYPARVYVVFSGGAAFWRTRAINYVWSSREPAGADLAQCVHRERAHDRGALRPRRHRAVAERAPRRAAPITAGSSARIPARSMQSLS